MNTICILNRAAVQLFAEGDTDGNMDNCVGYILWDDLPITEAYDVYVGDDARRITVADLPKEERNEILHEDLKAWAERHGHTITDIIDYR